MSNNPVDPESILTQALGIASLDERSEFVARACGGDARLRARVTQLLDDPEATRTLGGVRSAPIEATEKALNSGRMAASGTTEWARHTALPIVPGYEILEVLGRGGMGVVYKARQLNLKRLVALKMILAANADEEGLCRFRAEAEAAARLQHPHIVQIHEVDEHGGQPYIAFEFIDGGSLADYLAHSSLSNEEAAEMVETLARAMHYAHTQGVVHRDLKPGNVLLGRLPSSSHRDAPKSHARSAGSRSSIHCLAAPTTSQLLPKISDFGLAKQLDSNSDFTRTGAVLGTPTYMAPEQAAANREIGPAADIYSLGAILYTLIAHQPPFRGNSSLETMQLVQKAEPIPPRKLQPKVARDLETICLKCLEKKPSNRYESAEVLADDLRRYLNGEAIAARPASFAYRASKLANRHRTGVIIASLTIFTLFAGLLAGVWYSSAARQHANQVLSDIALLAELKDEYPQLVTVHYAARRETMESWIDRSTDLTGRLVGHRSALGTLRSQGQAVAPAGASEDKWRLSSAALQREHDKLQQLLQGIEALRAPAGMIEQVKGWASLAPFPSEMESRWATACTAIESAHALRLERCDGLYALGPDPQSQLWEFVDLRFGLAPRRDENGRLVLSPTTGFVFVLLPGGRFRMGSPESESGRKNPEVANEQQHDVELSPFFLSKYEVTQAQWENVMGQNPSEHLGPLRAAHEVSWIDCDRFCQKTNLSPPTEAQWEYACRAGATGPYNAPAPLDDIAWHVENSFDAVHGVGEKLPNRFGLYDMHGNVLEWCRDVFAADYYLQPEASGRDPVNQGDLREPNALRVLRGGSFEGVAQYLRSADRYFEKPERRWRGFGFRPVRQVSAQNG